MEENILKQLVKSQKILKKKFDSVKQTEAETTNKLERTYKPLIEPLEKLVKLSDENINKSSMARDNKIKFNHSTELKKDLSSIVTSTPMKKEYSKSSNESDEDRTESYNDTFYSQCSDWELNLTDLYENKKLDTIYGPYKNKDGKWKFGSTDLSLSDEKITVGSRSWTLTPGLYSLLFHKRPDHYDSTELNIYKQILTATSAHKRNFDPSNQLKGNRGFKYKKIISKLFATTHTGKGLMSVNLGKPNYIYWDDPNELVNRLRLLIASQQAGNNSHTNEIVSIIEELREANIIT